MAAVDYICGWDVVTEGGSGGPPQENVELLDVISCILVHCGDGHYLKYIQIHSLCI